MPINPVNLSNPTAKSIRNIFYQGKTTLSDMTRERMQATVFDAVRYLSKPYKQTGIIMRTLMHIKNPLKIEKSIIPEIKNTFNIMPEKVFSKLQKALVIIEDTTKQHQKIYKDSCEFYNNIVEDILNRVIYK